MLQLPKPSRAVLYVANLVALQEQVSIGQVAATLFPWH